MSSAAKKIRLLQQPTTATATTASSPSTATPTLPSTNTSQSSAHHQSSAKHYHPPSSLASMPGNQFHHFNARCAGCVGKSRPGFTTSGANTANSSQNGSGGLPKQETQRTAINHANVGGGGGSLAMLKSALNTLTNSNANYGNPNTSNRSRKHADQPSYISSKCPNDPPAICIPESPQQQQQQRSFLPVFTSSPAQSQQRTRKSLTPRMAKPAPPLPIRSDYLAKLPLDNRYTRHTRLVSYLRNQQFYLPYETPIPATHPLAYNNLDLDAMESDYWLQRYDGGLGGGKDGEDVDLWEKDSYDARSCWSGGSAGTNGVDEFVWDEDLEDDSPPPVQPPPIGIRLAEEQKKREMEQKRRDQVEMDRPSFLPAGGLPLLPPAPGTKAAGPPAIPPRTSRPQQQASYYRNFQNVKKERDTDAVFTMEVRGDQLLNSTNISEGSLRHKKSAGQWGAGCVSGIPQPTYTSYSGLKGYSGQGMAGSPYGGYAVTMGRDNLVGCY